MSRDEDREGSEQQRRAAVIARLGCVPQPPSPVRLQDMTKPEEDLLKRRHRRGPPLNDFQHDMLALLSPRERSVLAVRPVDSDSTPELFLGQMSKVHASIDSSSKARSLRGIAERHRLLPEFAARLETRLPSSLDDQLVVLQQRVNLPAFQSQLLQAHGAAYNQWLLLNGFSQVARSPVQQKRFDSTAHLLSRTSAFRPKRFPGH